MPSLLKTINEFREMRKELNQSIVDGSFGQLHDDPWDNPTSIHTAADLWSGTQNPWVDVMVPEWRRTREEGPWTPADDSTVSSEPLPYTQLSAADSQIRVLTLRSAEEDGGDASAPIRCELETVSMLAPLVEYEALSYMWGSDGKTRPIVVNGHLFQATTNLHAALRELRNKGRRRLWVDAVCINQADREERSQQVLRMRSIYARASRTVVWLGPESRNSNLAMQLLRILSDPGELGSHGSSNYREAVKGRNSDESAGLFTESWHAFDDLFSREYWLRVWIIQEIAVSNKIDILCGPEKISWSKLEVAFWGKSNLFRAGFAGMVGGPAPQVDFTQPPRKIDQMFDFWGWRKAMATGSPKPLLQALFDSGKSNATDPRDHIYSLLGITLDGSILVPVPNYNLPVSKVYTDVTAAMIKARNHDLDIICLQPRSGKKCERMPSWVPDWSNLAAVDRPWARKNALNTGIKFHEALIKMMDGFSKAYRTLIRDGVLTTNGRIYDVVDGLSTSLDAETHEPIDGTMVQPEDPTTCYDGVLGTAEAIQQALCMMMDYSTEKEGRDRADLLTNLWLTAGREALADRHPLLGRWLEANRRLLVGSVPLETWLDQHRSGAAGLLNSLRARSRGAAGRRLLAARLDGWMAEVEARLRGGMRLMTTARGRVGMAHPQARPGDHICLLEGMESFVLLRPMTAEAGGGAGDWVCTAEEEAARARIRADLAERRFMSGGTAQTPFSDGYRVVGEAYVRTTGTGKKVEDMSQCKMFTFFIH